MKKLIAASFVAALAFTATSSADAHYWRRGYGGYYGGYHYRSYDPGAAIALGMFGLALGAIAASQAPVYYAPPPVCYAPSYGPSGAGENAPCDDCGGEHDRNEGIAP